MTNIGISRKEYIHSLKLQYDPFQYTSAQLEFKNLGRNFYDFYVEPTDGILTKIKEPGHLAVLAPAGSGKTSLRLQLEAFVRSVNSKTFVVSYELKEVGNIQQKLLKNIVTDLLIQVTENSLILPHIKTYSFLAHLIKITKLEHRFNQWQEQVTLWEEEGISAWWVDWGKPVIHQIAYSADVRQFLFNLSECLNQETFSDTPPKLEDVFKFIKELGYTQLIFSLECDSFQNYEPLQNNLRTIWDVIHPYADIKIFLPDKFPLIYPLTDISKISFQWDESKLQEIITRRLQAAGSLFPSLSWYATPELASDLDQLLIENCHNSPYQLLTLINTLINIHCAQIQTNDDSRLTADAWALAKKQYFFPPPNPIAGEKSMTNDIAVPYSGNLYVGREKDLDIALQWCETTKRLLVISGLPKIGKSWFIQHLKTVLTKPPYSEFCQIYYFDIQPYINEGVIPDILGLVDDFLRMCSAQCPSVLTPPSPVILTEYMAILSQLGERLPECYPTAKKYIIIFDNTDELTYEAWKEFEQKILEPLSRSSSISFAITLRDPYRVNLYPLRFEEKRISLKALTAEEGKQQIEKLEQKTIFFSNDFDYTHPGINHFLYYQQIIQRKIPVDKQLVRQLLESLKLNLHPEPQIESTLNWLLQIAQLPKNEWSMSDLESIWDNLSASQRQERLFFLLEHWLVEPTKAPNYQIIPSLKSLLIEL